MANTSETDRQLLVAVVALQMNLITREDCRFAIQFWVDQPHREMREILADRCNWSLAEREFVDGLVREHLRLHEEDVRRSLAALSSLHSLREELQSLDCPELDATLVHIGSRSTTDEPSDLPGKGSRFRVIRLHARGGLGEVSVAVDDELNREVALKEIQSRFADDESSRSRFVAEAEITGGLEHPGIVPVYGMGQYGDGRPYYAMRFIRGDSLAQSTDRFHQTEWANESNRSLESQPSRSIHRRV